MSLLLEKPILKTQNTFFIHHIAKVKKFNSVKYQY